jgi:hypothetical protein
MTPTKEEQIEFANENSKLVDEMNNIISSGTSIENFIKMKENIESQRKLWENYKKKHSGE